MRYLMLLLLMVSAVFAQAPPQTVAFVQSPDNAAFSAVTPKPDFSPSVVLYLKITEPVFVRITIQAKDVATKPIVTYSGFEQAGWQSMGISLPSGFGVAGINLQVMVPTGNPAAVTTAQ